MALAYSKGMPTGTVAPDFDLLGVDGQRYSLATFADKQVLVVVFTCNHCPYAQAVEERLIRFQKEWYPKGVTVVAINPNDTVRYPDDSFDAMQARAREKDYPFPYLWDETQDVARQYDAACTPDFFVFDARRRLVYNGRFDDNWKEPRAVKYRDLERAVQSVLQGRPVDFEVVPSMGCGIKWRAA